jgi:molecular chaperone HscB
VHAAAVNDAFQKLRRPYERAKALLALRGVDVGETGETLDDPALLMEIMEVREALEEASTESDRLAIGQKNMRGMEACEAKLAEHFREGDDDAAAMETMRLRYLITIHNEVHGLID